MSTDLSSFKQIAIEARKELETQSFDAQRLKNIYLKYNKQVSDIDSFFDQAQILFPKLNCGLASIYLQDKLKDGEVINGKYASKNHTFLLIKNHIIIDITADQYGGPSVFVGALKLPWSL